MGELEQLARQRIRKWRDQNKVSQERLGQVTGTHQTTVGKWEKGDLSIDIDTLDRWARFFGRTLFDLVAHQDSAGEPSEVVAAFNALPTDDLRASFLNVMKEAAPDRRTGATKRPKRGARHE